MITIPRTPPLRLWSPTAYENLADGLRERQLNYLHVLVGRGERPGQSTFARARGHLADRSIANDNAKAWIRLRKPPDETWKKRLKPADEERATKRGEKPSQTVWTDDPIQRAAFWYQPAHEDVTMATARLAVLDDDGVTDTFAKPFGAELQAIGSPATPKLLVQAVLEFAIHRRQPDDKETPVRDRLLNLAKAVKTEGGVTAAIADSLENELTGWLNTLHVPVGEPSLAEDIAMRQWHGRFPGLDPDRISRAYGFWLANALFTSREQHPTGSAKTLSDLLGWLATLAARPMSEALPQLADLVSFEGTPTYSAILERWDVDYAVKDWVAPPAPPTMTPAELGRLILACVHKDGGAVRFRADPSVAVPAGWSWPECNKDGIYWWTLIRHHCVKHLLKLADTADFHLADVLRFAYRHRLFTGGRDPRVPQYVADCAKAALLNFKYWIDEPPATGHEGAEMTFWSENHQVLFHAGEFLVGELFPADEFPRSGRDRDGRPVTGREHRRRGRERVVRWMDRRLRYGFSEWCSPGYYNEDFPPLLNLADFAQDEAVAEKAAMVVDRLVFDLARFTCRGSFASSAGRAYFEHKCYGWQQSVGETIEVLFGSRGDHIGIENTAVAFCTSVRYEVPEALLAIGLDRTHLDRIDPLSDRSRVSINFDEGAGAGIGTEHMDDVAFWWGLSAYFTDEMRDATRRTADTHHNLHKTSPIRLLRVLDDPINDIPILGDLGGPIRALLLDAATMGATSVVAVGTGTLAALAPFPLNLALGSVSLVSIGLRLQSLIQFITNVGKMLLDGLKAAWAAITGDDPPEPEVPKSMLQEALEAMLEMFNRGNVLSRANLRTFNIGDAMLSSVQNHRPGEVSFQKLPWIATLGCDACVWTNAPLTAASGGSTSAAGFEFFKHALLLQGSDAITDFAKWVGIADMDDLKKEGLYEWGGSICLPRIVQHDDAAIVCYNFDPEHGAFSKTPTHAWFPAEFFDEVDPVPAGEDWLPERSDGGTWVFGRKDDGYVALYSARRVKWVRDRRFDADPLPGTDDKTVADGPFISTELLAEEGSNIWVCAIGSATRYGSFGAFARSIRDTYLHISGVGTWNQLQCTFDMPRGVDASIGGFRLELFDRDEVAKVDGRAITLDNFPRFANRYVEGEKPGIVDAPERSYRIRHPYFDLWLDHDLANGVRTLGPPQPKTFRIAQPRRPLQSPFVSTPAVPPAQPQAPLPPAASAAAARRLAIAARRRRFRLDSATS